MFAIENYDVQETRRVARDEGKIEGKTEGKAEGKAEGKIEAAVNIIKDLKISVSEAMRVLDLPKQAEKEIIKDLKKCGIPYVL